MDKFYEEVQEPVSPHGQYFNSSVICSYVFGFLELAIPIDDLQTMPLIKDVFLPINPRFSSITVRDKDGKMRWQRVEVKLEEHVSKFPETTNSSTIELYDDYVSDYVTSILTSRTPQDKPLWEIHIINYPTSNAEGTLIFKLHHAIGDGYSLMGALLSCLQRADDPSLPLSFPSRPQLDSKYAKKSLFKKLWLDISSFFSSISYFGSSLIETRMIEDDKTPIRSGYEGNESQPVTLSHISLSLDQIKEMKSKLGVAVAKIIYNTVGNSSVLMSNIVGPIEKMTLANHPVNGLYFTMTGGPEDVNITTISYEKMLRITIKTLKGFVDEHKLKFCIEKSAEILFKAAME